MTNNKAMTVREAAEHLGISEWTLRDWRKKKIENQPKSFRMGRRVVYYLKDLDHFKEQNEELLDQETA